LFLSLNKTITNLAPSYGRGRKWEKQGEEYGGGNRRGNRRGRECAYRVGRRSR